MSTRNVYFIDSRVSDYATLIADLPPDSEWFLLDADESGVDQMARILSGYSGLDSIQIISHGSTGVLYLGSYVLDSSNLELYQSQLQSIGTSLTVGGDILLYGCNVASSDTGVQFIASLANLTGADVGASNDLTGSAALGGNWEMEVSTGLVEVDTLDSAGYSSTLELVEGDENNNVLFGTANADTLSGMGGNDTLTGAEGNDLMDGGAGVDMANYFGPSSDYRFTLSDTLELLLKDIVSGNGSEGQDRLSGIERLGFSAETISVISYGETRINTSTGQTQSHVNGAALGDGGYLMTWTSITDVYAQRFDAAGNPVGDEWRVNNITPDYQQSPMATALEGGGYVVAWSTYAVEGPEYSMHFRRFDDEGRADGEQVQIGAMSVAGKSLASVTALAGGGFVAAWTEPNAGESKAYMQIFDETGQPKTPGTQISSLSGFSEGVVADVTGLADGGYVALWHVYNLDRDSWGVYLQRFDALGDRVGTELQVNTTYIGSQNFAQIATLADGGYVVTWLHETSRLEFAPSGVYSQRFDATGERVGGETLVSELVQRPQIEALPDGGYVVAMHDFIDGSAEILLKRFDAGGREIAAETVVNATTEGTQWLPKLVALADGGYIVAWSGQGPGDDEGVFLQRFTQPGGTTALVGDEQKNAIAWSGSASIEISGRAGHDTLTGGDASDRVFGDGGNDLIKGNKGYDRLYGNLGNDTLNGGAGADTLIGGFGDDRYIVGQVSDVVTELTGQGTDLVEAAASYKLAVAVENLTLTGTRAINGTGNSLANVIVGNSAGNVLIGGAGNDTMLGGSGNDTYVVAQADDVASELFGTGIDLVKSSVSWTIGDALENLTLTGTLSIHGTGNALSNAVFGNSAANTLRGMKGADTLSGDAGEDQLLGGLGNDLLRGGLGLDTLTGGDGADAFVFDSALSAMSNVDTVTDFVHGVDKIQLDDDIFTQFAAGVGITANQLHAAAGATTAVDSLDRLVYNTTTGALFYDADGVGGVAAVRFAILGTTTHPTLTESDFVIVA